MAHGYQIIQWTRFKKRYDAALLFGVIVFIGAYLVTALAFAFAPPAESALPIQVALRALGADAVWVGTRMVAR